MAGPLGYLTGVIDMTSTFMCTQCPWGTTQAPHMSVDIITITKSIAGAVGSKVTPKALVSVVVLLAYAHIADNQSQ